MHPQKVFLILCDPMDCSPPGSSVHGILQARILDWIAISFSRGSSPPRDWTWVSCTASRLFTSWATRETHASTEDTASSLTQAHRLLLLLFLWLSSLKKTKQKQTFSLYFSSTVVTFISIKENPCIWTLFHHKSRILATSKINHYVCTLLWRY